jgi:phosphoadenosine phosphosulfate reductase
MVMGRSRQLKLGPPLYMLVQRSVELLRANAPADGSPYYGCFSGGKDSITIKRLAEMASVPVVWHYNVIIDPPELVRFIQEHHADVHWIRSKHGPFFRRIREKLMVPTRFRRWCCQEYKHSKGPKGCTRILGIRIAESFRRAQRYVACVMPKPAGRREVYPIRLWSDENVWRFIREQKLPYCKLYDEGFTRLGCVGCPVGGQRELEFARWPRYRDQWKGACDFVAAERARLGKPPPPRYFEGGMEPCGSFEWWMNN